MKKLMVLFVAGIFVYACSSNNNQQNSNSGTTTSSADKPKTEDYDPTRGEGKFENVEVGDNLDVHMAEELLPI
jgi:hypothetical protein